MKELERESGEMTGDALKDVLDRYGRVETRYAHLDGYHYENNIKRVLMGLGYPESTWEHNALALSGGQKTRLQLAGGSCQFAGSAHPRRTDEPPGYCHE